MDGKAERALIAGTDNVYDLKRFKALKVVENYRGHHPDMFVFDDIEPDDDSPGWVHADFMTHHARMVAATNKIKARRDFIDGDISS